MIGFTSRLALAALLVACAPPSPSPPPTTVSVPVDASAECARAIERAATIGCRLPGCPARPMCVAASGDRVAVLACGAVCL